MDLTHGKREILGFSVYKNESKETWCDFLQQLKKRGLKGVLMITSDAHAGITNAINKVLPHVPWQRCQFHFAKNISNKVPKKYQSGIRSELNNMFNCKTIEEARFIRDQIIEEYRDVAETAMNSLEEGFESAMTVMTLPIGLRKYFRTSNHIERLNKELKRRAKVIGIFPNENSLIRLLGAVLVEQNSLNQTRRAIFTNNSYQNLLISDVRNRLHLIAEEQSALLVA